MSPIYQSGPAFGGDGPELLLHHLERESLMDLLDFPAMSIGVEAVISHRDLAFIGDMGSDPSDELQIVHPLRLFSVFPIPVADPGFLFIQGEALQGQKRADHVFSNPLGEQQSADDAGHHLGRKSRVALSPSLKQSIPSVDERRDTWYPFFALTKVYKWQRNAQSARPIIPIPSGFAGNAAPSSLPLKNLPPVPRPWEYLLIN
jgi:hypothetical protein